MEKHKEGCGENCEGEGALIANRRDGGEFRDERKRSKPWALRSEWSPGAELGAAEMQGRKAPRGRDTKKAQDAPHHGLEARSNGRSRDRNRRTGTGWAPVGRMSLSAKWNCPRQGAGRAEQGPAAPSVGPRQGSTRKAWRQVQERSAGTPGA